MRSRVRQRGTAYVLVLGIVSLLVVMGLASALLVRGNIERSQLEQDQAKARLLALSYLDIRHSQIDGFTAWRDFVEDGEWDAEYTLGDGWVQSRYVDEIDGNINNSGGRTQPFRLYVRAGVGDAVRIYSQEFVPDESNRLRRDPQSLRQETAESLGD